MGLKKDLEEEVAEIFRKKWTERDGQQVPEAEDLKLGNDAIKLDATVLYADMSDSTELVDNNIHLPAFAAEIYKAYLICAARVIKDSGGTITAYDGDRIMAVFIGGTKNTDAARAGLKINYAVKHIINPANKRVYKENAYELNHVVGIDTSKLFAARIGVHNDNDIVWVGRAANHAAKLSSLDRPGHVYMTADVFNKLKDSSKYGGEPPRLMWEERTWNGKTVYRSSWTWAV